MNSKWMVRTALTVTVVALAALVFTLVKGSSTLAEARSLASAAQQDEVSAAPAAQMGSEMVRSITVVGEGQVRIKPDIAQTNIGVEVTGPTVKEASGQAQDTMNGVIQALTDQGVEEKDIQTSGYNVWVERPYGPEGPMPEAEVIYHVSNSVSVTVRDLDTLGNVLDAAIEAGANNIFGVNFNIADPDPLMSQAREKAVANAEAKASELAQLNKVQVGQVISVSEVIGGGGGFFPVGLRSAVAAEGMGGGGGPISPGELEITVQLQVTYAIQ